MSIYTTLVALVLKANGPARELLMQATSATSEKDGALTLRLPSPMLALASPFVLARLTVDHGADVRVEGEHSAFLRRLTHEARAFGWSGDYVEIRDFVEHCHGEYGAPIPDLEPYPVVDGTPHPPCVDDDS